MRKSWKKIKYTWRHKKAFLRVEKQILGRNTLRGRLHDMDKIFLYLVMSPEKASHFHNSYARHHRAKASTKADYIEMIIDWECARFTKPDKPLNARETLSKLYPDLSTQMLPLIDELKL